MPHQDPGSHARRRRPMSPARIPFPDCIPIDAGAGFIAGGTGGSAFHFIRALRTSPSLAGGAQAVRANAPRLAGAWAGLFAAFSAVESAMYSLRRKEDPWNHIVAFACMRGLHRRRRGLKAAVGSALVGAVFWGLVEVAQIGLDAVSADPRRKNIENRRPLPSACPDGDPARAADEAEEVSPFRPPEKVPV